MQSFFTKKTKIVEKVRRLSGRSAGFSILFSVLVSSIVLAIGISLANKATRELMFANSGKESQRAFYSADTALECALYWDRGERRNMVVFATTTLGNVGSLVDITCNRANIVEDEESGWSVRPATLSTGEEGAVTTFTLNTSPICASVAVTKLVDSDSIVKTTIESRGYNTCGESARRLERGLRAQY